MNRSMTDEPEFLAAERAAALAYLGQGVPHHELTQSEQHALQTRADSLSDGFRTIDGASFILDSPQQIPAVWGSDEHVLWSQGEPLYIVGPPGVGKTTLGGQLLLARLGLIDRVLDWPVTAGRHRVLYLACDRPQQIARSLRRVASEDHREVLSKNLVVHRGPPPADLAQRPSTLIEMARRADADTVFVDSLKDVAIGISDDKVGAGLNQSIQYCIAEGIEVAGWHHQRKGQDGRPPKTLEDVYGSTWITAGAGSVILLWGQAGDLIVDVIHLKQPASEVGPLKIEHDHAAGRTSVFRGFDLFRYLRNQPHGATATDVARHWFEKEKPTDNERKKAQRDLNRLVDKGLAHREEPSLGGSGGTNPARYFLIDTTHEPGM
jgi:replicative DNA helicase